VKKKKIEDEQYVEHWVQQRDADWQYSRTGIMHLHVKQVQNWKNNTLACK
jgi:hypothetical protein